MPILSTEPGVTEVISTVCDKSFGIAIYSYCSVPSIKLYGVVFLDQLVSFKSILSWFDRRCKLKVFTFELKLSPIR